MLVSRLERPGLGAVTGYRWFTPVRPTVANALVYSMNCDVMSLLTRSSHHLIWGGSWAIRREVFDAIRPARRLEGNAQRRPGGQPADAASRGWRSVSSRPASWPRRLDVSLGQAMSFIRRQYLVARLYTFDWWLFSLLATTFSQRHLVGQPGRVALRAGDRLAVAVDSDRRQRRALPGDGLPRLAAAGPGEDLFPPLGEGFAPHPRLRHLGQPAGGTRPLDRRGQCGRRPLRQLARHPLPRDARRAGAGRSFATTMPRSNRPPKNSYTARPGKIEPPLARLRERGRG